MKPSSFQTTIENQFDYICKRAMEDERKNYMLYLSRIAKREVSFSDVGDYLVSQFATTDNYSTDFQIFTLNGLSVGVENDLLSEALRELPDKKREILRRLSEVENHRIQRLPMRPILDTGMIMKFITI